MPPSYPLHAVHAPAPPATLWRAARLLWLVLLACCVLRDAPASAQGAPSPDTQARLHFQSGTAYFERGEYEDAIREYENAYALSAKPRLQYNLYLAHERLGHLDEASQHLRNYLDAVDDEPNRAALEARIANLEKRAAEQERAEVQAASPSQGAAVAGASARPDRVSIATPTAGEHAPRKWPLALSVATAGVGLAGFAALGALALREDNALDRGCNESCSESELSTIRTYNLAADVSLGVAVVGVACSMVVWLRGRRAEAQHVAVAPWLSPRAQGVSTHVKF